MFFCPLSRRPVPPLRGSRLLVRGCSLVLFVEILGADWLDASLDDANLKVSPVSSHDSSQSARSEYHKEGAEQAGRRRFAPGRLVLARDSAFEGRLSFCVFSSQPFTCRLIHGHGAFDQLMCLYHSQATQSNAERSTFSDWSLCP